jgi:hypothetical protein
MAKNVGEITVDANKLMANIRVTVRMPRLFGVRIWLATLLFELAGLISGLNVVVEFDDGFAND